MHGLDWAHIGRETFDRVVDAILDREFGARGHAVDGRGGDEGIDYLVDDGRLVFQYKYFSDGFNSRATSRRKQITRSFTSALSDRIEEWVLVVPATLSPSERKFISSLEQAGGPSVAVWDRAILDGRLAKHEDLANYFRFGTDVEHLHAKAAAFLKNPVVRNGDDVQARLSELRSDVADADPDWTFDVAIEGNTTRRTLRPKHPNAATRSPITITLGTSFESGSELGAAFLDGVKFGFTGQVSLPANTIREFRVSGPPLVSQAEGALEGLEILPALPPNSWHDCDIELVGAEGEEPVRYLGEIRGVAAGNQGFTLELRVGRLISAMLRCPKPPVRAGKASVTVQSLVGVSPREAQEAAQFILDSAQRSRTRIVLPGIGDMLLSSLAAIASKDFIDGYQEPALLAEDLAVIEKYSGVRFRMPATYSPLERVRARNARLMFEGHAVADPGSHGTISLTLNGDGERDILKLLDRDGIWFGWTTPNSRIALFGKEVIVPELSYLTFLTALPTSARKIRRAFKANQAAGAILTMTMREGDCVRVYMPDRMAPDAPINITPWDLPGITQEGLLNPAG